MIGADKIIFRPNVKSWTSPTRPVPVDWAAVNAAIGAPLNKREGLRNSPFPLCS